MQHESVKWDRDSESDDAPRQQAMGQGIKPAQRKAPTQDQKRVRREMARKTADLQVVAFDPAHTSIDPGSGDRVCSTCHEPVTIKRTDRGMAAVHTETGRGSCVQRLSPAKDWDGGSLSAGGEDSGGLSASASFHVADLTIDNAGDRTCVACGYHGAPVLGDTGPMCSQCGSYSLKRSEFKPVHSAARHTATQIETNIASADGRVLLNPGDAIRLPSGQTTRVRDVRRHETSGDHYYVDTDMGTTVMPYSTKVQVVPSDTRQQGLPSYGDPRANSNQLPGHSQNSGISTATPSTCPVCGGKSLSPVAGGKYRCSKCNYTQSAQGGMSFSDNPQQIAQPHKASLAPQTAVGRRAAEVLELMKETPL